MQKQIKLLTSIFLFLLGMNVAAAQDWTGTWTSTNGDLRLQQVDNLVFGDYANVGVLYGGISVDASGKRFIEGTFENYSIRKTGVFKFRFDPNDPEKFIGEWTFNSPTKWESWTGKRMNKTKPTLKSFYRVTGRSHDKDWKIINENYDVHFKKDGILHFHTKGINSAYNFFLPKGDWEIEVKKPGFKDYKGIIEVRDRYPNANQYFLHQFQLIPVGNVTVTALDRATMPRGADLHVVEGEFNRNNLSDALRNASSNNQGKTYVVLDNKGELGYIQLSGNPPNAVSNQFRKITNYPASAPISFSISPDASMVAKVHRSGAVNTDKLEIYNLEGILQGSVSPQELRDMVAKRSIPLRRGESVDIRKVSFRNNNDLVVDADAVLSGSGSTLKWAVILRFNKTTKKFTLIESIQGTTGSFTEANSRIELANKTKYQFEADKTSQKLKFNNQQIAVQSNIRFETGDYTTLNQ
ncbi:hypothetical protein ACFOUP_12550 [Belliella kenyensis]|uniref:PEGA domain-containing protein n=1 Tax=Belliella kenyensis TaxID=1472724 RepID=A0ABV8ENP7_9BACT|nr:hypothetical protein [Belliella kenyensis]MCH7400803.1 hypothetical protein [Belliella kenyensis]MDN3601909.1 hypothetical protein [Belliella kenyensis]